MTDSAPGTTKVLVFAVDDENGDLYDPPGGVTVLAGLVDVAGTAIVPTHPATGMYRVLVPCLTSGDYACRLEAKDGAAAVIGAFEKYWRIRESRIHA